MWQHLYDAPVPTLPDPSPSPEDVNVTRQIVQAGKLLDIELLDHLVIADQGYVSLKERNLGFD
jgi:DNA repair protein RadC